MLFRCMIQRPGGGVGLIVPTPPHPVLLRCRNSRTRSGYLHNQGHIPHLIGFRLWEVGVKGREKSSDEGQQGPDFGPHLLKVQYYTHSMKIQYYTHSINIIQTVWKKYEDLNPNSINIFTDGSKINNKVGCAYIVYNKAVETHSCICRLGDENTVFMAELHAIKLAIEYVLLNKINNVNIISDSQSVLSLVCSFETYNNTVNKIKEMINGNNLKINLYWVKAHIGITQNERADELAKLATNKEQIDFVYGYSKVQLKSIIKKKILIKWQENWNITDKGRHLYQFYPKVKRERCSGNFYLNQIVLNHGAFPIYQNRFFGKSGMCFCGAAIGDLDHVIFRCQQANDLRIVHFPRHFNDSENFVQKIMFLINDKNGKLGLIEIIKRLLKNYLL